MKRVLIILFIFTFTAPLSFGQEANGYKGRLSIYWGWNRSVFSSSTIQFQGPDHNFTLYDVKATDRPTPFAWDPYFNPALITTPQTNYGAAYFINDQWQISISMDHMKYVMIQDQDVIINGQIDADHSTYRGTYDNENIKLTQEFLKFEHTDGLNYGVIEMNRFIHLIRFAERSNVNIDINVLFGGGGGVVVPKSNILLWGQNRSDKFHLAGFGLNAKAGLNICFFKYFFLQSELKAGYIHMNDIITSTLEGYKAKQGFSFLQWNIFFGAYIPLNFQKRDS